MKRSAIMHIQTFLSAGSLGALLLAPWTSAYRTEQLSFGMILFPGFTPLDVFGPLELLYQMSGKYNITLSTIAATAGPVPARSAPHHSPYMPGGAPMDHSGMINPTTVATHTFADAPKLDVILVPGGLGEFVLVENNNTEIEKFLVDRFDEVDYLLSVCTGAVTLARAGLLKGKRATTNKRAWSWVTDPAHGKGIEWIPSARWVEDGKIWTSSGVSAGIDMMYSWMKHVYGTSELDSVMNRIEYAPHTDAHWDPYSVIHKVPGANVNGSMTDCIGPLPY